MKNKFSLLIFSIASFLLSVSVCQAKYSFDDGCSTDIWSDKCQQFIRERDFFNNLRQIPRTEPTKPDHERDYFDNLRQDPHHHNSDKYSHSSSEFLNMYLQDYSDDNFDN